MEKRTLALIGAIILIAVAIVYLGQFSHPVSYAGTVVPPGNRTAINAEKAKIYPFTKEIAVPSGFVNVDNITIGSLVGKKVILLDFWTYSCINCERTIPYLNMWYEKYHDRGLEIIGVHTPEFQFEHDIGNVRQAVQKFGIKYPVVLDNDYATWNSYGNQYWPEHYLIDIDGFIVDQHIGEGDYDGTEKKIQALLKERADALGEQLAIPNTTAIPSDAINVNFSRVGSPETYFGAGRNEYLGNGKKAVTGLQTLVLPATNLQNTLYLGGTWNFADQYAETAGNSTVVYRYNAMNVYFVASAAVMTNVSVSVDGKPAGDLAGPDAPGGVAMVKDERLYQLVAGNEYSEHTLVLDIPQAGLRAYTFTFG